MITENLPILKIHKMTEAQFKREKEAGRTEENALYLTPDEDIDLSAYATKDDVENIEFPVYAAEESVDVSAEVINADTLGGYSASDFRHSDWMPTIAEIGAAPAGFGYGGTMPIIKSKGTTAKDFEDVLDEFLATMDDGTVKQVRFDDPSLNGYWNVATLFKNNNDYAVLFAITYGSTMYIKSKYNGTWSEWVDISPSSFAPSGYGLGDKCVPVDSWDNATKNGYYSSNGNSPDGYWWCGEVFAYGGVVIQHLLRCNDFDNLPLNAYRSIENGNPTPWEWGNPPMVPGVEYRTTERWNGSPVYCKCVDCGEIPSGAATAIYTNKGAPVGSPIKWSGLTADGISLPYMPYVTDRTSDITVGVQNSTIFLAVGAAHETKHIYVNVWYIK